PPEPLRTVLRTRDRTVLAAGKASGRSGLRHHRLPVPGIRATPPLHPATVGPQSGARILLHLVGCEACSSGGEGRDHSELPGRPAVAVATGRRSEIHMLAH